MKPKRCEICGAYFEGSDAVEITTAGYCPVCGGVIVEPKDIDNDQLLPQEIDSEEANDG